VNAWWSWLLTAVGVLGLLLAGRKLWWAWCIGLGAQVLWIAYAIATDQHGFIVSALAYGFVYARNALRWRADGPRQPDRVRVEPDRPARRRHTVTATSPPSMFVLVDGQPIMIPAASAESARLDVIIVQDHGNRSWVEVARGPWQRPDEAEGAVATVKVPAGCSAITNGMIYPIAGRSYANGGVVPAQLYFIGNGDPETIIETRTKRPQFEPDGSVSTRTVPLPSVDVAPGTAVIDGVEYPTVPSEPPAWFRALIDEAAAEERVFELLLECGCRTSATLAVDRRPVEAFAGQRAACVTHGVGVRVQGWWPAPEVAG
jgi:hypothetical protein